MYSELMTPNQLGKAMLAFGGMALFDALISASISQVIFYFGSKEKLKYRVYEKIKDIRRYSVFLGGGLIFGITLLLVLFPEIKNQKWIFVILVLLCYFAIEPSKSSLFSFLNVNASRSRYGVQVMIDAVFAFVMIFLALLYEPHWVFLILGMISARFFAIFTNSLLLKKTVKNLPVFENEDIEIGGKEIYKRAQPIMLMGILGWITAYADRYIIAGTLNIIQTGYYSVASGLVGKPYNVVTSAYTAYFKPSLFKAYSESNRKEINKNVLQWLLGALIIGIIGAVLFVFFGEFVVKLLLAAEYRGHVENILWVLALTTTFTIAIHAFDNKFLAAGKGNNLFWMQLWIAPVSLLLIGIGSYCYGMLGAVYGKLISSIVQFIFTWVYSKKI
jgi:O-antigen/teichoic acid export membrane protein